MNDLIRETQVSRGKIPSRVSSHMVFFLDGTLFLYNEGVIYVISVTTSSIFACSNQAKSSEYVLLQEGMICHSFSSPSISAHYFHENCLHIVVMRTSLKWDFVCLGRKYGDRRR